MEDWALIRHLYHSEKFSKRAIATKLGIARDTVTNALTSDGPPNIHDHQSTPRSAPWNRRSGHCSHNIG